MKIYSKNRPIFNISFGAYTLFVFTDCYAYLDPGTGAIILQTILASLIGVVAFISTIRYKIISFFSHFKKKSNSSEKKSEKSEKKSGIEEKLDT